MKRIQILFSVSILLIFSLLAVTPAYALTDQQDICEDNGGTWTGADAFNGSCGYGLGNEVAENNCGEHAIYTENFSAGASTGTHCKSVPFTYGGAGGEAEHSNESVTLSLGQGKNGSATFSPDACPTKCTISANLFRNARNVLPSDALAALSVRIVGGAGGSYLVCFKTTGLSNPSIYKFAGGTWVRIATLGSGNSICAATTGTASFYLGAG
jgi:hypothetical protein